MIGRRTTLGLWGASRSLQQTLDEQHAQQETWPNPQAGLGRSVPGDYTVTRGAAIKRSDCNDSLFDDDTLCCIQRQTEWECRRVKVPEKKRRRRPEREEEEEDTGDPTCVRAIQLYLVNQQRLSYAQVTGKWNRETERALSARFDSPRDYPGGACAILATLGIRPDAEPTRAGVFKLPTGVKGGAIAALGVAVLVGALLLARRG